MTQTQEEKTCAAIDVGSNSTEMLVARCGPDFLQEITDDSTMTRLGEGVEKTGEIESDKRTATLEALRKFQREAKEHNADPVLVVATEAMREASNGQEFVEEIQRKTGLQVHIIGGIMEAALTYHGALYGQDVPDDAGVLDVGGASTELATAQDSHITWLVSLPIGSGWLHDAYLNSDPPTPDEVEKAQEFLGEYLPQLEVPEPPKTLVVTGSSAKALLKIAKQALNLDDARKESNQMTREDLLGCKGLLLALPAEEVAKRYEQSLERAQVLPGGALLLLAMMDYLKLDQVQVSEHGVREGVLLAYTRYGDGWLDHPEVNPGEERQGNVPSLPSEGHNEPFVQAGKNELPKRAKKFLDWRGDVLKHEDVEAVHKMRVASRRLRATMDGYEPVSRVKPFKQAYQRTKKAADLLGAVRDTDVMIEHVQGLVEKAPVEERAGLQWLTDRLGTYRKDRQQDLDGFLQKFDEQAFQTKVKASMAKGGASNGKS